VSGIALAEAVKVNTTLHTITLSDTAYSLNVHNKAALGVSAYEAFNAMLRVNTDFTLNLPPFNDTADDERLVDSRNQSRFSQSDAYRAGNE
jgi:hypothetical protein